MASVLFSASREANVEQCQECARAAGLELLSVEAAPAAAARAFQDRFGASDVVALAVVGETKTDVMIFDGSVCRVCYSANAGLPEEADSGNWVSAAPAERDPFVAPPQLYSELTHCFRFFQNQFPRRAVERVIMAADHPQAESIASHLSEQLQLPVEPGRPGAEFSLPSAMDNGAAALSRALTLALVRGAVLSASTDGGVFLPINLIPETATFWKPARPYIKIAGAAMLVLLAASLLWAWSLRNKITQQDQRLASVTAEIGRLEPELEALRAMQATELALRSEVERQTARVARERAVRWSQILVDLADRLPRDMWLTRVASPDSSRISLVGIATNEETIPRALESLSGSPYLERVVLGSFTKDDAYAPGANVYRYQINARLLRGMLPPPSGAERASQAQTGAGTEGSAR